MNAEAGKQTASINAPASISGTLGLLFAICFFTLTSQSSVVEHKDVTSVPSSGAFAMLRMLAQSEAGRSSGQQ
jgi:hypothetical protein